MACASFDRRAGEEAAVEERKVAEGACFRGAMRASRIERAEGEGCEEAMPEPSAIGEGCFGVSCEEGAVIVQPAFGLEEFQEEQACDVDQGEGASVVVGNA